jgi:hypothetical protein
LRRSFGQLCYPLLFRGHVHRISRHSPQHHARLASGRWSGATGRAFHPQGSTEKFQNCIPTSRPPFSSFLAQSHRPGPGRVAVTWAGLSEAQIPAPFQELVKQPWFLRIQI